MRKTDSYTSFDNEVFSSKTACKNHEAEVRGNMLKALIDTDRIIMVEDGSRIRSLARWNPSVTMIFRRWMWFKNRKAFHDLCVYLDTYRDDITGPSKQLKIFLPDNNGDANYTADFDEGGKANFEPGWYYCHMSTAGDRWDLIVDVSMNALEQEMEKLRMMSRRVPN